MSQNVYPAYSSQRCVSSLQESEMCIKVTKARNMYINFIWARNIYQAYISQIDVSDSAYMS